MIFISRAVGISIMTKLNLTQLIRIFILSLLIAGSHSHAEIKQVCTDAVIAAVKKNFRINENHKFRASACKALPDNKTKLLVAMAYEPPNYSKATNYELPLYIAEVDIASLKILSKYEDRIWQDAVTRLEEIKFDMSRYFLTPKTRAFGIRTYGYVEPRFSEGGMDDFLWLYVIEGEKIRPVMQGLSMRVWSNEGGTPGGPTEFSRRNTVFTLNIAPTTTHGFADLLISAKTSARKKIRKHLLRYDGEVYPFDLIDLQIKLAGD